MKLGDTVWISYQNIDACGYGDSVNTEGMIVGKGRDGWVVEFCREWSGPTTRDFYEHDLTLLSG